jgi:hypothetical protein
MVMHILDGLIFLMNINEFQITYVLPTYLCKVKRRNNIDQSYVYVDNFWEKMLLLNFNFSQKSGKNGKRTTSQLILKLPEIKILSTIGRNEREHFKTHG